MDKPIRLTPSLREKVWGRTRLAPWYPDSTVPVGEAWFLSDRELPLLVKWIFTGERLSVQVHPDDGEDGPRGKTEMWHILEAAPGATIDIPLAHKDALYVRSHYDGMTITLHDCPLPDEIAIIAVYATRGRPHHRVGGLAASDITGIDGLV